MSARASPGTSAAARSRAARRTRGGAGVESGLHKDSTSSKLFLLPSAQLEQTESPTTSLRGSCPLSLGPSAVRAPGPSRPCRRRIRACWRPSSQGPTPTSRRAVQPSACSPLPPAVDVPTETPRQPPRWPTCAGRRRSSSLIPWPLRSTEARSQGVGVGSLCRGGCSPRLAVPSGGAPAQAPLSTLSSPCT